MSRISKWVRSLFGLPPASNTPVTAEETNASLPRPSSGLTLTRRETAVGILACLSAPVAASGKAEYSSITTDPYFTKSLPPEEKVVWSKADQCYVWISKLLGKDEREWDRLSFDITAGISETDPSVCQKGDRIRMFFAYDSPGGITIGSVISAATHKSVYSEPKPQTYNINSVTGMDAARRARLIVASPGPFAVNTVFGKFRVTSDVVERYHREYRDPDGNPPGSMPDPEIKGTTFFTRPNLEEMITRSEYDRLVGDQKVVG